MRAALTLVARGEAALGIVYSTDAKVEPNVKIVGAFPADSHPAIVYPVALTVTAKPDAAQYLAFLRRGGEDDLRAIRLLLSGQADVVSAFRRCVPNAARHGHRALRPGHG